MATLLIATIALLVTAIGYELLELYPRPTPQQADEQTDEWAQRMQMISISFF
jgi:hypothetical protein